jgi:cytochrome c oxidase assembly protein subunit 11
MRDPRRVYKVVVLLALLVAGMFAFGYASVPMYNSLCKKIGLNGRSMEGAASKTMDTSREITVQFLASTNAYLPWKFYPETKKVVIHPGQNVRIAYYAENQTNKTMTVQAIPSVSPSLVGRYLKKTECFCFKQQTFTGHKHMDMPILFHLDTDIPKKIHTVTLSYTLFDVSGMKKKTAAEKLGRITD